MSSKHSAAGTAARVASAIAAIAKGAAAGGLHGAAAGAVKAFLPEIIKATVIITVVLTLLPMIIFAAIPNILFGYESSSSADIISLNDKAYSIDAAYKEVESYGQDEINRIITETLAAFTSEENGAAYDDVEVLTDMTNTNIYWFIAITSVANRQNLFAMNDDTVKNMVTDKIEHTAAIHTETVGEGDAAEVLRTLKIDIRDLTPHDLMDMLSFTDADKNWANVLYTSLAEDQYVGMDDSDGYGYYNTNYGSIRFTDAAVPVVYYNQTDSRWGNIKYGKTGTISSSGCGPTALAIAVASLADSHVTPRDTAKWAYDNGYRCEGNGSYHSLIPDGGAHYGLTVESIGHDANKLAEALSSGKLVVALMSKGHFTSSGHFIVLRGITSDGKVLVADPASVKRSNQEWNLRLIINETSRKAGSGGPLWVIS